jgi:PDDEXK-like family of unknown function
MTRPASLLFDLEQNESAHDAAREAAVAMEDAAAAAAAAAVSAAARDAQAAAGEVCFPCMAESCHNISYSALCALRSEVPVRRYDVGEPTRVAQACHRHQHTPFCPQAATRVAAAISTMSSERNGDSTTAPSTSSADLAAVLAADGHEGTVHLREALPGGTAGGACLRNLRHSFVILSPDIIVDPAFREAFEIPRPSVRYEAALRAAPTVFVGPPSALARLVEVLCSEMATAFAVAGTVLPPWRGSGSMLRRWLPRRSLDMPLRLPTRPAPAVAAAATKAALAMAACASGISSGSRHVYSSGTIGDDSDGGGLTRSGGGGGDTEAADTDSGASSTAGCPHAAHLSNSGPTRRERSYEPAHRVVGGFGPASLQREVPLVQCE